MINGRLMRLAVGLAAVLLLAGDGWARIKLVTLPVRERVAIQLDHPDVTLIEEQRVVTLTEGVNQIDFSWANTRIDPQTIVFRALPDGGDQGPSRVEVLSVSYPPGEPALVWAVSADAAGSARVQISYLLGGLGKTFHYRALASRDETRLTLSQYLRVNNNASEAFDDADIWPGFGDIVTKPLDVNETKEVLIAKYTGVPVEKTYRVDAVEHGYADRARDELNVPLYYVLNNDSAGGLGRAPLPYGKARIFQQDGRGGSAFLGEDWAQFTPIDDRLELYLGLARDIKVRRTVAGRERTRIAGNLYRYDVIVEYRIENFKTDPARLRLVEHLGPLRQELGLDAGRNPEWSLGPQHTLGEPDPERSDVNRLSLGAELPASTGDAAATQPVVHRLHLVFNNEW